MDRRLAHSCRVCKAHALTLLTNAHAAPILCVMGANTWGRELRAARIAEGDSQDSAAQKLAIHRGHLSRLELGQKDPSVDLARRAFRVYHVPLRLLAEERMSA